MGFMIVTAVLVVSFGRLGDMYGRVRMYNARLRRLHGLLDPALGHLAARQRRRAVADRHAGRPGDRRRDAVRQLRGDPHRRLPRRTSAAWRSASTASRRSPARSSGSSSAACSRPSHWRLVFLVSVPFGLFGTVWAYLKLRDLGERRRRAIDWWGNLTFAVGLVAVMVGITYGIQPYGGHTMGWTSPKVLARAHRRRSRSCSRCSASIETRVEQPMFHLQLFRIRAFAAGNIAEPAVRDRARRPAVHADHLAAGHLAAPARLQLRRARRCGPASTCCR